MLKKIKIKNIIVWNVFFLIIISLGIILHVQGSEKYNHAVSPEILNYIENEASFAEVKTIAISRSKTMFSMYENNYRFYLIGLMYVISNLVLLINEHINQRKKQNKVPESTEA